MSNDLVLDPANHDWRYKVLYFDSGGSANLYWTDSRDDAYEVLAQRDKAGIGAVIPLTAAWWKRNRP